ncbi:polysaccharide deacetylase family protein [Paractinoplanes durhamensis]|uniref:Polysaccharide deacetylase familiy protein n=1 Tax=Paractinoplanes durhamensis TaxID=113563 RepID=A0ABQ3YU84_9ACTN|nr:polysaccharide deacetylase family protein [Actinoplanes durhamensis]GIE01116.1 polysaccharide deacetylase familiy protein [Actinoplanes durhamensis]
MSLAGTAFATLTHPLPSIAAIGPLRRRLLPGLAGLGDPRHVALTFDDGPHPEATPELLRILGNAGVRATFFLLGRMAEELPEVARAIADAGHEIGVHGYDHRLLARRGPAATRYDLDRATAAITAVTGARPRWWRPPYGVANTAAMLESRRLGLRPVLWTTWGRDWTATCTPDSVYRSVLRKLDGGGTILLHDSDVSAAPKCWLAMLGALPPILTTCRARGLAVGPLAEHRLLPGRL